MTISLIICTRNRAGPLVRCLAAVAGLNHAGRWELIVVDNGSSDDTAAVVAAFAAEQRFPVRCVSQPVKGLSNARNAGVAVAIGDLVFFTDDDCYVESGTLDAVAAAFADPGIGYASGRVRLFDPDDYPVTINESLQPLRFPARRFLPAGMVKGANLAFRRAVLDAIGPFDPLFGSGGLFPSEDADAAMRASLAGWDGAYDPDIVVWHHHGRKQADVADLYRSYDIGRGAFHAKLIGLKGGLLPGLAAWAGLPGRARRRAGLWRGEWDGALGYWRARRARV
jgi:glycosyltransferase involved in cell wall biosynthesis